MASFTVMRVFFVLCFFVLVTSTVSGRAAVARCSLSSSARELCLDVTQGGGQAMSHAGLKWKTFRHQGDDF